MARSTEKPTLSTPDKEILPDPQLGFPPTQEVPWAYFTPHVRTNRERKSKPAAPGTPLIPLSFQLCSGAAQVDAILYSTRPPTPPDDFDTFLANFPTPPA
jgi:hypothetical protein